MKTFCLIGLHNWEYIDRFVTRKCKCCGKTQITINTKGDPGELHTDNQGNLIALHQPSRGDVWKTTDDIDQ